ELMCITNSMVPGEESMPKKRFQIAARVLFLIYAAVLIYFLFFADWYGHAPGRAVRSTPNLIPFREINRYLRHGSKIGGRLVFLNLIGNVIGFMPFGFILPLVSNRFRKWYMVLLCGFLLTLLVESVQLITGIGIFDVDDMILNTMGALLGYLVYLPAARIGRSFYGK
ncbi:MAG: VanZ family protein, partial [Eubacteriales bacterium]